MLETKVLTFGEMITTHGFIVIMSFIFISALTAGMAILFLLHVLGGGNRGN